MQNVSKPFLLFGKQRMMFVDGAVLRVEETDCSEALLRDRLSVGTDGFPHLQRVHTLVIKSMNMLSMSNKRVNKKWEAKIGPEEPGSSDVLLEGNVMPSNVPLVCTRHVVPFKLTTVSYSVLSDSAKTAGDDGVDPLQDISYASSIQFQNVLLLQRADFHAARREYQLEGTASVCIVKQSRETLNWLVLGGTAVTTIALIGVVGENKKAPATSPNKAPTAIVLDTNTIDENVNVGSGVRIGALTITDPDVSGNNNVLSLSGADAARFAIRDMVLYFVGSSPDFEAKSSYAITVTSTDGSLVKSQDFTVNVSDVNEAPTAIVLDTNTVDENVNVGSGVRIGALTITDPDVSGNNNVLSLSGADAASFAIRGMVLYFVGSSPNFEAKSSYALTVKSTDGSLTMGQDLEIQVADQRNEIRLSYSALTENSVIGTGTLVGILGLYGPDVLSQPATMYELDGDDAALFEVRGNALYFVGDSPDYEKRSSYQLGIHATQGQVDVRRRLLIEVLDVLDSPPVVQAARMSMVEGKGDTTLQVTPDMLGVTDAMTSPALVNIKISNLSGGIFRKSGSETTEFTLKDVQDGSIYFVHTYGSGSPVFTLEASNPYNSQTVAKTSSVELLTAGMILYGDGSGAGGGAGYASGNGGNGGGDNDTLLGTLYGDVMFGDGSGGGEGASYGSAGPTGVGGKGGAGDDTLLGGDGDDFVFGDGFDGSSWPGLGGQGGYGGGGSGAGTAFWSIGGGAGGTATGERGYASTIGTPSAGGGLTYVNYQMRPGGGGGVSADGSSQGNGASGNVLPVAELLAVSVYERVLQDLKNNKSEIFLQTMGAGKDLIDGGVGNDWLLGGGGTDTLIGGAGADQMWGGAEADVFVFRWVDLDGSRDRIFDFDESADRLDFSDFVSTSTFDRFLRLQRLWAGWELLIDKSGMGRFDSPDLRIDLGTLSTVPSLVDFLNQGQLVLSGSPATQYLPSMTIAQGERFTLNPGAMGYPQAIADGVLIEVRDVRGGYFEQSSAVGESVTSFTVAQLKANQVRFVHDGSKTVPAFEIRDDAGGLLSQFTQVVLGFDEDLAPQVNAPQLTLLEGRWLVITQDMLGVRDADSEPEQVHIEVTDVSGGKFLMNGQATTRFTLLDVQAGRVSFAHSYTSEVVGFKLMASDQHNAAGVPVMAVMHITSPSGQGRVVFGDGSGSGGAPGYTPVRGGDGGGDDDYLRGTAFGDVIFGDGSGGGAGMGTGQSRAAGSGGLAGAGRDTIVAGDGDDFVFGDGFDGGSVTAPLLGGKGGYGGGGSGSGNSFVSVGGGASSLAGAGKVQGGNSSLGVASLGGGPIFSGSWQAGGGAGVSADGSSNGSTIKGWEGQRGNVLQVLEALDVSVYERIWRDLQSPSSEIFSQTMGAGRDVIDGGDGNDWILAGGGDDTIRGGSGSDHLWGGAGADTFVFELTDLDGALDSMRDFDPDVDVLDFRVGWQLAAYAQYLKLESSGVGVSLLVDKTGRSLFETPDLRIDLGLQAAVYSLQALAGMGALKINGVLPVQQAPRFTVGQGQRVVLDAQSMGYLPLMADSVQISVRNVKGGFFALSDQAQQAIDAFTLGQLRSAQVSFVQDGSKTAPAFEMQDDAGGRMASGTAVRVGFVEDVAPKVAAPRLSLVEVAGEASVVMTADMLGVSDIDSPPQEVRISVSEVAGGSFKVKGASVTEFTLQAVQDGQVSFVHSFGDVAPAFKVAASDAQNAAGVPVGATVNFTDVVYASSYGIVSSTTVDQTALISTAINDSAAKGKRLVFEDGVYVISGNIVLPDRFDLAAEHIGKAVMKVAAPGARSTLLGGTWDYDYISNGILDGFLLDGINVAIYGRVGSATIKNNVFLNAPDTQLYAGHGSFVISDNVFVKNQIPVIGGNGGNAITTYLSSNTTISGNVIGGVTDSPEFAKRLTPVTTTLLQELQRYLPSLDLRQAGYYSAGVYPLNGVKNLKFVGNAITGDESAGYFRDHAFYAKGFVGMEIVDNYFSGWPFDASGGVKLRNGEGVLVKGNYFDHIELIAYTYNLNDGASHYLNSYVFKNVFNRSGPRYWENGSHPDDPTIYTAANFNVFENQMEYGTFSPSFKVGEFASYYRGDNINAAGSVSDQTFYSAYIQPYVYVANPNWLPYFDGVKAPVLSSLEVPWLSMPDAIELTALPKANDVFSVQSPMLGLLGVSDAIKIRPLYLGSSPWVFAVPRSGLSSPDPLLIDGQSWAITGMNYWSGDVLNTTQNRTTTSGLVLTAALNGVTRYFLFIKDSAGNLGSLSSMTLSSVWAIQDFPIRDYEQDGELWVGAQPPVMTSPALIVVEGKARTEVTLSNVMLGITDTDSPPQAVDVAMSDVSGGYFVKSAQRVTQFTLKDVHDGLVTFVHEFGSGAPTMRMAIKDYSSAWSTPVPVAVTFTPMLGGYIMFGDGSGSGGGASYSSTSGGKGGGDNDVLMGTLYGDVIFGDGSGGGEGYRTGSGGGSPGVPGAAGAGHDQIFGGDGDDVLFGDGFTSVDVPTASWSYGTAGGYGGGGSGAGNTFVSVGGGAGGTGYGATSTPGSSSTIGVVSPGGTVAYSNGADRPGSGAGVSADGTSAGRKTQQNGLDGNTLQVVDALDATVYMRVLADLQNPGSEIYSQLKGAGNDVLRGGRGRDWLMGGGGDDNFVWQAEDLDGGVDYVVDFAPGDKLQVLSTLENYSASSVIENWIRLENGLTANNPFGTGSYSRLSIDAQGQADFSNAEQVIVLRGNPLNAYASSEFLLQNAVLV